MSKQKVSALRLFLCVSSQVNMMEECATRGNLHASPTSALRGLKWFPDPTRSEILKANFKIH